MDRIWLEEQLTNYPLYQYEWIKPSDLLFTDRVRYICRTECPMYGKSWACPPAVGEVEDCKAKCMQFENVLMISTITEVNDIADIDETLSTRAPHESVTREIHELIKSQSEETLVLSTEACAHCEHCTYPDAPCRFPDRMYPCVESYGILVTDLAEKYDIDFQAGGNLVTWFSLIFYR